jgi:hypothetical protein
LGVLTTVGTDGTGTLTYDDDSSTVTGALVVEPGGNVRFVADTQQHEDDLIARSKTIATAAGVDLADQEYPGSYTE